MTTTQELIARLRDYEYEGCGVSVTQDAADALEALQAENDRQTKAKDAAINLWNEAGKGLQVAESERNAALARLAAIEKQEPVGYVHSCGDLTRSIIREKGYYKDQEMSLYAAAGASPQPEPFGLPSGPWSKEAEMMESWTAAGASPRPTMDDALAAGDGLLNALIDKLQARVTELEAQPVQPANPPCKPVAWVEVKDRHEGPYEFHGIDLLDSGKHNLYTSPQIAQPVQPIQAASPVQTNPYGPRPVFGAIGTRDIDVAAAQKAWDEAQPSQARELDYDQKAEIVSNWFSDEDMQSRAMQMLGDIERARAAINAKGTK